jgi:hypothetical protein
MGFGKKEKEQKGAAAPAPAKAAPAQAAPLFSFAVQLANGSDTQKISNFTNVKEMYEVIAKAFHLEFQDVVFCTLNTPAVDMNRLLGGQIVFDDFIYAHVRGESKTFTVHKSGPTLGLSITDNGAGSAFVKRIYPNSVVAQVDGVKVGDMISAINGESVYGLRHSDVAQILKAVPVGGQFQLSLVAVKVNPNAAAASLNSKLDSKYGAGKKTLRFGKDGKGAEVVDTVPGAVDRTHALETISDLLESFMGIRDVDLASSLFQTAERVKEKESFNELVQEELGMFEFPKEFVFDIYSVIHGGNPTAWT